MTTTIPLFALALVPVLMMVLGASVAAFRPPSPSVRSAIQHFAAGVVFSVVAVELLPDVTRVHDPWEIGLSFAGGVLVMMLLARFATKLESGAAERGDGLSPAQQSTAGRVDSGQLVAIGIDILIDGLLVGIAAAAGAKEGMLLTAALSLELLSLGLSMAAQLTDAGASRTRTICVPLAVSLLLPVGAWLGVTVLRGASEHTLAGVLAFGCAALLYLVTEELLVEAHEVPQTQTATVMFFAGFLVFLLLGMTGG